MSHYAKHRVEAIAVGAAITLTAAPAFAGGGEGFPWTHWGVSMLNFAIFFGVMVKYAGPKIQEFFKDRADGLRSDIEEAKRLRVEAQERLEEYSERLDSLEDERKALMDQYRAQGKREQARMVEDAKRQVDKMKSDAELVLQQEVRKAVAAIEHQAVALAVDMARTTLRSQLDPQVQNTLVDQFVTDLKSMEG